MAVLRLGFLANFLSHPVISGFITASGILIAAGQLKHILGIHAEGDSLPPIVEGILGRVPATNIFTLPIGVTSLGFLFWVRKRLKPRLIGLGLKPRLADLLAKAGPLAVIVVSILLVVGFGLDRQGVKIVGEIPAGLPPFALPMFDASLWVQLLPAALLISRVGFVEPVSVAQTLAAKRRQRIEANRDPWAWRRSQAAGVGFHLSEVKGPVMDALKRSDFFEHFEGQVFLSQFEAMRALQSTTAEGAIISSGLSAAPVCGPKASCV